MNKRRGIIWRTRSYDFLCFTLTVKEEAFFIQRAAANIKEDCNYYTKIIEDGGEEGESEKEKERRHLMESNRRIQRVECFIG